MNASELLDRISRGRTDLVFDLLGLPDLQAVLHEGQVKPLQWFVCYNDTTALKVLECRTMRQNGKLVTAMEVEYL